VQRTSQLAALGVEVVRRAAVILAAERDAAGGLGVDGADVPLLDLAERLRRTAIVDEDALEVAAELQEVGPGAPDRSYNAGIVRVEHGHQPRFSAFDRDFRYEVGAAQSGLGEAPVGVVEQDCKRRLPRLHRLAHETEERGTV